MANLVESRAHSALRESIQDQNVTIPSIYKIFPDWEPRLHQDYQRMRDKVLNPWIERWVVNPSTARALQAADFGVFAAVWGPDAPFDVLCTAAKYFAWYFVYDDSMFFWVWLFLAFWLCTKRLSCQPVFDCGALKHDEIGACKYREASLQYFKFTLLGEGDGPDLTTFDIDQRNGLQCWDEVGQHIRQVCSRSTREILCDEMLRYIGSLNRIDSIFMNCDIPSVDKYWERREATAAAYCVIATLPYEGELESFLRRNTNCLRFIYGVDIDRSSVESQFMKDLWRHTSYFVHITNDMLSVRKELSEGQFENLIPVLMLNKIIDCNAAMYQSYQLLHNEAMGFRQTKRYLLKNQSSKIVSEMFTEGCLNVAMGLAHWSYSGNRYFNSWEMNNEKEISFTVKLPSPNPKPIGQAKRFETLKYYALLLHSRSPHALLSVLRFSPLIALIVISMAPRVGTLFPSFRGTARVVKGFYSFIFQ